MEINYKKYFNNIHNLFYDKIYQDEYSDIYGIYLQLLMSIELLNHFVINVIL